jgi:hypothetical protein
MVQSGLSEKTVILVIKASEEVDFDTTPSGLIALNEAEVSEGIIQAILASTIGGGEVQVNDNQENSAINDEFPEISIVPAEIQPEVGKDYFTRYNFYYEKGEHPTTNYSRGTMVPINTKVILKEKKRNTLHLEINGETVKIENVKDYSRKSIDEIASKLLSENPIPIEKLGNKAVQHIITGQLKLGMTKEQVLMTRGYPPAHETHDTNSDRWVYWSSRFVKRTLLFEDGRLTEGRGID